MRRAESAHPLYYKEGVQLHTHYTIRKVCKMYVAERKYGSKTYFELRQKVNGKSVSLKYLGTDRKEAESQLRECQEAAIEASKNPSLLLPFKDRIKKNSRDFNVKAPSFPQGPFDVLYCDPPWQYDNSGLGGAADKHYPTLPTDGIVTLFRRLDIKSHTTDNAVLFLWVTNPFLPDGLRLISDLDFEYKTNIAWVKQKSTFGKLGFYVYGRHEILLIGVRGSMLPTGEKPESILNADTSIHSRKPEKVYKIIETMYPNAKKCELFARQRRSGWESWGNLDELSES